MTGSSTESHISHLLSARLSSRPMGRSKDGADKIAQIRIYWKNGGEMLELVRCQKEEKRTERKEEETYFSASEMNAWERKHRKTNGKYIEALQAGINSQVCAKIFFRASIADLC